MIVLYLAQVVLAILVLAIIDDALSLLHHPWRAARNLRMNFTSNRGVSCRTLVVSLHLEQKSEKWSLLIALSKGSSLWQVLLRGVSGIRPTRTRVRQSSGSVPKLSDPTTLPILLGRGSNGGGRFAGGSLAGLD